jgi:hypothetical protein
LQAPFGQNIPMTLVTQLELIGKEKTAVALLKTKGDLETDYPQIMITSGTEQCSLRLKIERMITLKLVFT